MSDCSPKLANDTLAYLSIYHKNIDSNSISNSYDCFREYLKVGKCSTYPTNLISHHIVTVFTYSFAGSNEYYYRSCVYANVNGCNATLADYILSSSHVQDCYQCSGRDGCNPAGYIKLDMLTILSTIIMAAIVHYLRH